MKKNIKSANDNFTPFGPFDKPYEDLETGIHRDGDWRGVPGVRMIWHGEWSDPELEYNGIRANYWDIEDTMYEWAKEDGVNTDNDEEFNKYCQEHDYDVYSLFDSYIESSRKNRRSVKSSVGSEEAQIKQLTNPETFWDDVRSIIGYGTGRFHEDWDIKHLQRVADKRYEELTSSRKPIQSMYVTEDISGNDLYTCLWSGGKDQFDSMIEDGADADDILNACEELLFREEGNPPTMTELNDLIWFEPDTIREYIGLSNPIESGCHGKSKKKGKKKAVKSSMSVRDLPRDALHELKERYYAEKYDQDLSYGELANIDDIVSDEEVFDEYDGTSFTEDDFFCLASSRKAVKSGLYDEAKDFDPNDYEWGKVYDFIWNKYSTRIDRALNDLLFDIQEELGITTGDTQLDSNVDDCVRKLIEVLTDQYGNRG